MAQKFEFLFILPDSPSGAENREAMTAPHEDFVGQTQEFWLAAGPTYAEHKAGTPAEENGSWVLLQATTQSEAFGLLQRDPFTTGKVWDWDKAQILCVKSGLRVPFVKDSVQKALEKAKG